ncbi:MAG: ABC transporter ATP-binding protein [Candidatus Sumerlaeia bacterium]
MEAVIDVENLAVQYKAKSGTVQAVKGISFKVNEGECVGFIGPNGAGKSSTIKCLMGFHFPESGSIRVFGKQAGTVESKLRIGYLPEVTLYYPFLKATEMLKLYGGLQRVSRAELKERIPELLEAVGLGQVGDRLIREYSKGMQQRLGIAQALIARPDCLIFDELSSGLDPVGRYDLREVLLKLKEQGVTIFFSSHELYEVEALCDRVIAIHQGRLLFDKPLEELKELAGEAGLEQYFMDQVRSATVVA